MARRFAVALVALLACGFARPAGADDAPVPVYAQMPAHPALWTVHGPKGTAYLFGSVHILPPQVDWHTKEIDAAIARADTFVFEIAIDGTTQAKLQNYIRQHAMLPKGQHLRDMLAPDARADFDKAVAGLAVAPQSLDRLRPWFAALTIDMIDLGKQHYSPQAGIEMQLQSHEAKDKPVIGLETVEQQLGFLAPKDPKLELQAFEAELRSTAHEHEEIGPLLDAWMQGDTKELARLTFADMKKYPQAQKILIDDRNKVWVKQISALLNEDKVYFITVGAAHLVGPRGVPALLRAKGLAVDGP